MAKMHGSAHVRKCALYPSDRLLIGTISNGWWTEDFGMSLAFLLGRLSYYKVDWAISNLRGSILPNLRNDLVRKAEEWKATHLLFLDSDQTFPANVYELLRRWDAPFAAACIATKSVPCNVTAFSAPGVSYIPPQRKAFEPVWRVGCGVALLRMRELLSLPEPRFPMVWKPEAQEYQGEDWGLCERYEAIGVSPHIDAEASWKIGHIGKFEYNLHMAAMQEVLKDAADREGQKNQTLDEEAVRREEGRASVLCE